MIKTLAIALSVFTFLPALFSAEDTIQRPNIVLIMADDLGYGDLSCYGSQNCETPHLDRLATNGIRFTDFHSSGAVCSPTRAGLLTGRYQQRAGIDGVVYADPEKNRHHGLQKNEITLAQCLQDAGYQTGMFGKWHLGYQRQYNPTFRGFQQFVGYVSGNVDYFAHLDGTGVFDWWHNAELNREEQGYVTHLINDHAVEFIRQQQEKPFFVYIAHEAVHSPYQGPHDQPMRKEGGGDIKSAKRKDIANAYREMNTEMDKGIGQIVDVLKEVMLTETVISIDLMPTLLELANAKIPAGHKLDGVSLVSLLKDRKSLVPRQIFWEYNGKSAMRQGPWKLIMNQTRKEPIELYDLTRDMSESKNLADNQPQRVQQMQSALAAWKSDVQKTATTQPEK